MDPLEPARRGKEHRHQADRKLRHVARCERQRTVLRPPGVEVLCGGENRPRPGPRLSPAQTNGFAHSRALAWALPELRTGHGGLSGFRQVKALVGVMASGCETKFFIQAASGRASLCAACALSRSFQNSSSRRLL